jgi:hypothetical protein
MDERDQSEQQSGGGQGGHHQEGETVTVEESAERNSDGDEAQKDTSYHFQKTPYSSRSATRHTAAFRAAQNALPKRLYTESVIFPVPVWRDVGDFSVAGLATKWGSSDRGIRKIWGIIIPNF